MFPRHFLLAIPIILNASLSSAQQPVKDHPLVSRVEGSQVLESDTKEFDEYTLILGPLRANKFDKTQRLEGKLTHFKYSNPPKRSTLEIIRSYQNELQRAGFQVLFACSERECGTGVFDDRWVGRWCIGGLDCDEPMRYIAAKLGRPGGDAYVAIKVMNNGYSTAGTFLNVIEVKPMEAGLVTVNAASLANDIVQTGHASVYGIYFDTGKAALKPESNVTLAEISKLLLSNAQLKLHVVGHTDNVGTFASNMTLSKNRADAVVAALVSQYHVAGARLQPSGVGPLAPVATNKTEDGRAKNRRVELVEQ